MPERCPECNLLGAHRHGCSRSGSASDAGPQLIWTSRTGAEPASGVQYAADRTITWFGKMVAYVVAFVGAGLAYGSFHGNEHTAYEPLYPGSSSRGIVRTTTHTPWYFGVLGVVLAVGGGSAAYTMRQEEQNQKNERDQARRSSQQKPFILYLRSFTHDQYAPQRDRLYDGYGVYLYGAQQAFGKTEEERWVKQAEKTRTAQGRLRVIAVGNPNDELPPIGAVRYRFTNRTWQTEVERLMRTAWAVVLVPGTTDAVIWESDTLVKTIPPERAYIWCAADPPEKESVASGAGPIYSGWRAKTAGCFPVPLPAEYRGFLGFAAGWQPLEANGTGEAGVTTPRWMLERVAAAGAPAGAREKSALS